MPADTAPVEVGIIGTGNFARCLHLPNLVRIPECRLRAVCDLNRDTADDVARRFNANYATTDHRRILDDPAVRAVVIAVRDDAQAPLAIAALEAGKHVYVEKPLAPSAHACAPVVTAQQRSGHRLVVGFNRRYAPAYRKAKELLAADGGGFNFLIRMTDDAWRWAQGYPPGALLQHDVCHLFDLLRWLTGAEIESVYCISSRPDDDLLSLRLSNGAVASISQSGHGTMDMPKERLEVITRRGGVRIEDFVELRTYGYPDIEPVFTFAGHSSPETEFMPKHLYKQLGAEGLSAVRRITWELRRKVADGSIDAEPDAAEARRFVERTIPNFTRDQGWMEAMRAFIRGIQTGAPTDHANAEDALAAARVAQAAVKSRESGAVEKLQAQGKSQISADLARPCAQERGLPPQCPSAERSQNP